MRRTYLDHNATWPLRPEARDAIAQALEASLTDGGNPSSVHAEGRRARARVEAAREEIASRIGALPEELVFTCGATEAANLAIAGAVAAGAVDRLIVSAIEHDAVLEAARACAAETGVALETLPVTARGEVDVAALEELLSDGGERALVAVMHANNETGVIQPIGTIARMVRDVGGRLLVDAAQAFGKTPTGLRALGADYLVVSAHKLGGPAGVGGLAVAGDAPLARRQHGGGQERGRRAGTENLAGIAGFAAAAVAADADVRATPERETPACALRDDLEARLRAARSDVRVWGAAAPRLWNTSCVSLPGFPAETQVMALDLAGVAVSAGAACSSGKVRPSHVLAAMGAGDAHAGSAIRVSLGWDTTEADVERFLEAYLEAAERTLGGAAHAPEPARTPVPAA